MLRKNVRSQNKRPRTRRTQFETLESRQLLTADAVPVVFAVADASLSPTNAGLIVTSDVNARTCEPVRNPFFYDGTGFSGLAYDTAGQLWATSTRPNSNSSALLSLKVPDNRVAASRQVLASGQPIRIDDLAFASSIDTLLGIHASSTGGGSNLYAIDRSSGEATLLGNTGLNHAVAIGIGGSGELFVTSYDASNNSASLHTIDLATVAVTRSLVLSNPLGRLGAVQGLSDSTAAGLLIGTDSRSSEVVAIDPLSGERSVVDLAGAPFGVAGDVALIPFAYSRDLVYSQDFEHGDGGFTVDNSGGTIPGLWHLSVGRRDDGLINHTRVNSFYYGAFETNVGRGTYLRPFDHQGVIISPEIDIPAEGLSTLSFNYLLETRPQLDRDFVDVSIDNGTSITPILSRQDGTLPQTGREKWLTATSELAAFAGQSIRIRFHFDTGDAPTVDPEGWYVDDIKITNLQSANTFVEKSIDDPTPNEGQTVIYTVIAGNLASSLSTATGVTIVDVLPSEVTFVSATTSEGVYDEINGQWTGLELVPGESQTLTIVATVSTGTSGTVVTNFATIEADQDDPDPDNNMDSVVSQINRVDLSVTKTADDETPNAGQSMIYTITASNAASSNADATDVMVQETLPSGVTFVSASSPDFDPITQKWNVGDLAIGLTETLTITVIVNTPPVSLDLANTVSIIGNETDPDTSNNSFTQTSTVNAVDLSVTKTSSDEMPNAGQTMIYTITASNDASSNADATDVMVQEMFPTGVTFVSASSPDYDPVTQKWTIGDLAIGTMETLTITVMVNEPVVSLQLANTVVISGTESDPDLSNNTFTQTSTVNSVDLQVAKVVDNASPSIGDVVTFTITVTNDAASNAAATDVVVRDVIPEGLQVLAVSSGGTLDTLTREVAWSNVSIEIGEEVIFTVTTLVEASASGKLLRNAAVANGDESDPDPTTNTGGSTIAVGSTIQFIAPISVYRVDGPTPAEEVTDLTPGPGLATIAGYKWHDINQNGEWDSDEVGRSGWQFFLDADNNGIFDPETESATGTDANGRYVFKDLMPGPYTVREAPIQLSAGIFEIRSADSFTVTVAEDEVREGQFGVAGTLNFGVFDYSPFIRPADAFALRLADANLVTSVAPWQSFTVNNTSESELTITSFDTSQISGRGAELIRVHQLAADGSVAAVTLPITVPLGASESFLLSYDPAIRDGDTVIEQFPDWLGDKRDTNPAHRFTSGDHLLVFTDQNATFNVSLVGGSTYDSDISYDGLVSFGDFNLLRPLLVSGVLDPTSDINARCPNGAELVLASCAWPLSGTPARSIDLGDFGPLNRELDGVSARSPFLDLDPANRSGASGADFFETAVDGIAPIAENDLRFANNSSRKLESLIVRIENPRSGDSLRIDPTSMFIEGFSFNGGTLTELDSTTTSIEIANNTNDIVTLEDFADVLRQIRFQTSRIDGGMAVVSVQAIGSLTNLDGPFSSVLSEDERLSNIARARILLPSSIAAPEVAQPMELLAEAESAASDSATSEAIDALMALNSSSPVESIAATDNADVEMVCVPTHSDEQPGTVNKRSAEDEQPILIPLEPSGTLTNTAPTETDEPSNEPLVEVQLAAVESVKQSLTTNDSNALESFSHEESIEFDTALQTDESLDFYSTVDAALCDVNLLSS